MKTLKLTTEFKGVIISDEDLKLSTQELVYRGLKNIVAAIRLSEDDRRRIYKAYDAIEAAIEKKAESVELEDDWFGAIRKAKKEADLPATSFFKCIEALIDEVRDR